MSNRSAEIKVKLDPSAFRGGLKKGEQQVKASGKRMGKSLGREMDAGIKRGQKALKGMGQSLGRMIKQAGTIGAAFATGALIKDSLDVHKSFQDISFLLSKIPAQAMSWQEVQTLVTNAANDTTRTTKEMASSFEQVYKATGDLKYSKEILQAIGKTATASGKPIEQIAQVAEMVRRKWGVTGKAAEDAIAKFVEKSDQGGLSLDQLSSRLDAVAGEAALAGMDVGELLGTISQLDATMGAMAPRGMKTLLQYIKEGATQTQRLEKAGKFKFEPNDDALDRIRMIIKSPEAHKQALEVFTETSRTAFDELRKPFTETLEAAKEAGLSDKEARAKGLEAYDKMVKQIRHTEMTAQDIDRLYAKRVDEDPSVKMRDALNKIRDAFAQPKMIDAISKLADKLPALAKAVADLVSFIMDSPLKAAGVGLGLRAGLPMMMGGMMQRRGGGGLFGGMGGVGGVGPAQSGLNNVGGEAKKAGGKVGKFGTSAGNAIGQLAGAAALGYTLGKAVKSMIETEGEVIDLREKERDRITNIFSGAMGKTVSTEEKVKAITQIKKQQAKEEKRQFSGDIGYAEMMRRGFEVLGGEREFTKEKMFEDKTATASLEALKRKEITLTEDAYKQILKRRDNEIKAGEGAKALAEAMAKAVKEIEKVGGVTGASSPKSKGGKGGRGTKKLSSTPGAEPQEG